MEESECIPLQLQRLFAMLQFTTVRSVETKGLTTSFGWSSAESFQQHDVQVRGAGRQRRSPLASR